MSVASCRNFFLVLFLTLFFSSDSFAVKNISKLSDHGYDGNVTDLMIEGNDLWIGTKDSGIIRVDKNTADFNTARETKKADGLISDVINGMVSAHGKVFVATAEGLSIISGESISNHDSIEGASLAGCGVTTNGVLTVIFGRSSGGGILLYDGNKFKKIFFYENELANIADAFIDKESFYLLTKNGTIYTISNNMLGSPTEWNIIVAPDGLFDDAFPVRKTVRDAHGVLWIITGKNLYYFDGINYVKESLIELSDSVIFDVEISGRDFKYLATSKGILAYVSSRAKKLGASNGLTDNNVSALVSTGEKLYISTAASIDLMAFSSVEEDRIACLSCHSSGKNDGVYEDTDKEFTGVGSIEHNPEVASEHSIKYFPYLDLSDSENNECIKCHGRFHPDEDAIVINADTGIAFSKDEAKREFCLSCHDLNVYLDSDVPFSHQLANSVPVNVENYYNITGHGAKISLSGGEAILSNNDCLDCHEYHSSKNASLIVKDADYPLTDDKVSDAVRRDAFCKTRCHSTVDDYAVRPVTDHTWEVNEGESRDNNGCPEEPCDTHPSNSPIPNSKLFKYPSELLPLSDYDTLEGINLGYIVCTTCHDPHGTPAEEDVSKDQQMLRLEWTQFNTLCVECHQ